MEQLCGHQEAAAAARLALTEQEATEEQARMIQGHHGEEEAAAEAMAVEAPRQARMPHNLPVAERMVERRRMERLEALMASRPAIQVNQPTVQWVRTVLAAAAALSMQPI